MWHGAGTDQNVCGIGHVEVKMYVAWTGWDYVPLDGYGTEYVQHGRGRGQNSAVARYR